MEKPVKNHWVFDIETLLNCIVFVFEHYKLPTGKVFIIHKLQNDTESLIEFLEEIITNGEWLISFNGIEFDSQIIGHIMSNKRHRKMDGDTFARILYKYAQKVINSQSRTERSFTDYPEWKLPFKQVDLFKMHHWDRKGCGLKWAQNSMDWYNVLDMPIHHSTEITTWDQINTIVDYCSNDVTSTKAVLKLSKEQIQLRQQLTQQYNINLYSASETKIAKELFLHFISEELGIDKRELKTMRTPREHVYGKDIILPYVKFASPEMQKMYQWFKNLDIDYTLDLSDIEREKRYKYTMNYRGMHTDYGLGGIHGARGGGIYETGNGYIIMTSDVTSFYPNLAIENGFGPAHLDNSIFCRLYKWFFDQRKQIPKKDPRNYVYKIILNSTYGLSKEANCFLFDPEFTMKITINGQLSLSMLYEMLAEGIPGSIPLMQNTDGIEFLIPEQYKVKYMQICAEWERITKLKLEHDQYDRMFVWDVNNYIAVTMPKKVKANPEKNMTAKQVWEEIQKENIAYYFFEQNGDYFYQTTKCKGRFEWEDQHNKKVGVLHKNKSFLVIPKTIFNYFVHGIRPETSMEQNRNIFDYCGAVKAKEGWYFTAQYVETADPSQLNNVVRLQKMNRFFVSNKGAKMIKHNEDGREQRVVAGKFHQTVFNEYQEKCWDEYNIDTTYYLRTVYKEIGSLKKTEIEHLVQKKEYVQAAMF